MYSSIASNSACGGVPTPSSILTNPMNRGISIPPLVCGWWTSRRYVEREWHLSTSIAEFLGIHSTSTAERLCRTPDRPAGGGRRGSLPASLQASLPRHLPKTHRGGLAETHYRIDV